MSKQYIVIPMLTGCLSGALDHKKLNATLNEWASKGWNFKYSIHETKKVLFFFQREAHFLIFEKNSEV